MVTRVAVGRALRAKTMRPTLTRKTTALTQALNAVKTRRQAPATRFETVLKAAATAADGKYFLQSSPAPQGGRRWAWLAG